MADDIFIVVATGADSDLVDAMQHPVSQLSASAVAPTLEELQEIVASGRTTLLLARDPAQSDRIVGSLTLALFRIPTGIRAWIEDVVVDAEVRSRGVGEVLVPSHPVEPRSGKCRSGHKAIMVL